MSMFALHHVSIYYNPVRKLAYRCGYDMKEGETPLDCLRRMEKERDI
jgi:hypothetical protein